MANKADRTFAFAREHAKGILTIAFVGLFLLLIFLAWRVSGVPPRQADPVPTASSGSVPQARAAYDPFVRLTGLIAIVTPLVTTAIGYWFGSQQGSKESDTARRLQSVAIAIARIPDLPDAVRRDLVDALEPVDS